MRTSLEFIHDGKPISLVMNDYNIVTEMMKENTFYEHWLLEFIRKHFTGGIFIDVGANTGNHSIYFSKYCNATVIAIEPYEESYTLLCENVRDNSDKVSGIIETIKVAISNYDGRGQMEKPITNGPGSTSLKVGNQTRVMRLDSLVCEDYPDIRLIKVDVEGNEVEVIEGAMQTIEKHHPELFIEIWTDNKFKKIDSMLAPLGYEMKERYCHAPVYHFSCNKSIKRTYKKPA